MSDEFQPFCVGDGVSFNAYDSGAGPGNTALLINAYGMPFDAVRPVALELVRRNYRVVSWDCRILPGGGRPFMDPGGVAEHCADAKLVLAARGIERVDLAVGWCTGARILLHLAASGQLALGRALLLNGAYIFDDVPLTTFQAQLHEVLARLADDQRMAAVLCALLQRGLQRGGRFSSDPLLGQIVAHPFADADRLLRYAALFRDVASTTDDLTLAAQLNVPVTVVAGLQDEVTSPEASRRISEAFQNSSYLEFDDGSHYLPYTHAERLPL